MDGIYLPPVNTRMSGCTHPVALAVKFPQGLRAFYLVLPLFPACVSANVLLVALTRT